MKEDLKKTILGFKKVVVHDPMFGRFGLDLFKEEEDPCPSKIVLIPEVQMDDVIAFLETDFCNPKQSCGM